MYSVGILNYIERIGKRYEGCKKQGYRSDLKSIDWGLTVDFVGSEFGISGRTVSRYLRICLLVDELKELFASGDLAIRTGVELSYISEDMQRVVAQRMQKGYKLVYSTAVLLRKLERAGCLDGELIIEVMQSSVR